MSLLHRLLLLVFLALVPAAVIEVRNELTLRTAREADVHQGALRLAALFEAEQERLVDGLRQLLSTLANSDAVRNPSAGSCQTLMDSLRLSYPAYLEIHVAGRDGIVGCATDRAAVGVSIADRRHFRDALGTDGFAIGEHIRQRTNGLPALPVGSPYRDDGGTTAGVITALIDIGWLDDYLSRKPLPPNAALTLIDRGGTVIARVPNISGIVGSTLPERFRPLMTADAPGTVEMPGFDGQPRIIAYMPVKAGLDGIGVLVALDKSVVTAPIDQAMHRALGVIATVMVLTLLAVWWGGNRFVRQPTALLVEAARRWRDGDWSARTGVAEERSELGTLGRAFDAMAVELEKRAQAGEQANATAHKMAAVLASTTDGVFEVDRDWRITFMNDRARLLIANGRDLIGRSLWDAFPEAVGTVFSDHYHRAMDEQEAVEFEGFFPPLDAWYVVRAFPSRDGLAVFFQDITTRKHGEAALEFANQEKNALLTQLNGLLESAPVAFAFFDREHRYIRLNQNLADLNGLTVEAHLGRPLAEVIPSIAPSVAPLIDQVFRTGQALPYREVVGETPKLSGVRRHWLAAYFPVHRGPEVAAVGAVVMEISDLRQAEAGRRQSDERFRSVFESAAVGIERLALDGRYLDVNAKLCSILGYRREELLERSYRDITEPDDLQAEDALLDRLLGGEIPSYAIEKRCRRKDGAAVWVRVTSSLARLTGTEMAYRLSIVEDITEAKTMEEALRAAKDEAERADLAKSKFLAAASHDLRQPLQSLFFFSAALAGHVDDPKAAALLRHLEQGLDALKGLLDSLLDVSRLDAGVVTPVLEDFDVAEVLDPIRTAFAPLAAEKGLDWRVEGCAGRVRSDRTLLGRMVRNLVDNALRYTESGLVRVLCKVDGRQLSLVVQDTGIGIPADHLERIFEEFHQVGNPERDRNQGLGLGLAIVRRLSRLLDHPVEVRSVHGQGSAFRVLVPLSEATVKEVPKGIVAAPVTDGAGRFAVLVDDDAIVLMGLQMILKEWGYTVLAAGSADQAMDRLAEQPRTPDIVVADYRLREGRVGTEVIAKVRDRYGAHVPGVILTGETGSDCLLDAAAHGLAVIHKPVTPRQLGAVVEQQMRAVAAE